MNLFIKQFFYQIISKEMRLVVLLMLCNLLAIHATVYSQNIVTMRGESVPLKSVLVQIEQDSQVKFVYRDETISDYIVSFDFQNTTIEETLNVLLRSTGNTYHLLGNNLIVITPSEQAQAQGINITGRVIDSGGETLPGVSVMLQGTMQGTVTDLNGVYSLTVPDENAVLVFSFIGFSTQEIIVGSQRSVNVTLIDDASEIEELVVIGYGTRARGAMTGSVVSTDSRVFESRSVVGTMDALQGALPGVTVIRGTTRPGADEMQIQVRGQSSLGGASPLILIDGIAGDLNLLNPSDIENVTVLRDAAASIYGARASDGVILITTKRGRAGAPRVRYSGNYGIKMPHFMKDMATTLQMVEMVNESRTNMGEIPISQDVLDRIKQGAPPDPDGGYMLTWERFPGFYETHDWLDMVFGNGSQQNHNLSISGGSENSTYRFSAGYNRDEGFFKFGDTNKSDRYNISISNNFRGLFNRLNVDTRINFDNRRTREPSGTQGTLEHTAKMWRFIPMHNPEGNFYMYEGFQNPANRLENGGNMLIRNDRITFNSRADLNIVEGLKLIGQYGITITQSETKTEIRTIQNYDWNNSPSRRDHINDRSQNGVEYDARFRRYSSYTAYLEYTKSFAARHHFNLMAGSAHEENYTDRKDLRGENLLTNDLFTMNLADKTDLAFVRANTYESDWALTSFFGRIGYNLDMKYMLDFTLRADGSSKFAPSKRWSALFPAVSAAWNLGNENFVRSVNLIDQLKIRLSWGQSGNQELSFGDYDYIALVNINNSAYPFGIPGTMGAGATSAFASEARTWETITTSNAGIDFALLRSRLSGSFDIYLKRNSDMLVRQDLPALLGGTAPTQNIGELETRGFELTLGWRDRIGDFSYGISFMLSDSKNKLVKLLGSDSYAEGLVATREGYPLNSYFGYESVGIIKTQAQLEEYKKLTGTVPAQINLGDIMYRDIDDDGQITAFGIDGDSGDMKYLGNRMPRYLYSSTIDLAYKNFDLRIFVQGVGKREIVREGDFRGPFIQRWFQPLAYFHEKTWTQDRPDATIPRITEGGVGYGNTMRNWNYRASDASYRLIDKSYLRIKLITLGYRVPQDICNAIGINSVRIYASGENLITFANGTWGGSFDPEEEWQRRDAFTFPFHKTVTFGIDINF